MMNRFAYTACFRPIVPKRVRIATMCRRLGMSLKTRAFPGGKDTGNETEHLRDAVSSRHRTNYSTHQPARSTWARGKASSQGHTYGKKCPAAVQPKVHIM